MCFEIFFAECKKITLGKEALCRVSKKHLAKAALLSAQKTTLGKPPVNRQRAGLR